MNQKINFLRVRIIVILFSLLTLGLVAAVVYIGWSLNQEPSETGWEQPISDKEVKSTFVAFGDSGTGSDEQKVLAKLMVNQNPDVTIHTGDLVYPRGGYEEMQKNVLDIYLELFEKTKFYPSLGNHDYLTENGQPFVETFSLPGNERYYYFHFKNALFIALDSNAPLDSEPNKMIPWLEKTLVRESKKAMWIFVYFHHPPFSTGAVHANDLRVQEKIVPILEKYKVDVTFSGHEHNYQRSCEILKNNCVEDGVMYIVSGGGGAPLYELGKPAWFTKKQVSRHHFVKGEVVGCRLTIKATGINENILDSVSISKC